MQEFFARDTRVVAKDLIGKVLFRKYEDIWLQVMIIESEAYLTEEKASHSFLGMTEKKRALFMPPGTIYMYYSRGKDSLNISTGELGDAVLIKSGIPYTANLNINDANKMLAYMHEANPNKLTDYLCSGQTLLAKALNIKVSEWDKKQFNKDLFYLNDVGYSPNNIVQTKRLGIPEHRDAHLMYRYIDLDYIKFCTKYPITKKSVEGIDYIIS